MFEQFSKSISHHVSLTKEELDFSKTLFVPKKLRKRQYLLQEGDICRYTSFIEKGMLRTYTVDEKGNEPILQFSSEGWWSSDISSFLTEEPSILNIEALENCEILQISKTSLETLLEKVPAFERYFRILAQNGLVALQRRLLGAMSETAEEKYIKLINNFPGCIERVPLHMIASYLGITRETLSRIRKQLSTKRK